MNSTRINPYAAPESFDEITSEVPSDRETRLKYLDCEKEIQSIGWLMILGAVILGLVAVFFVEEFFLGSEVPYSTQSWIAIFCGILCPIHLLVGIALVRLKPWSRLCGTMVSVLWLLAIPFGTLVALGAIWSLARPKAAFVFSQEYREIITRTPNVRLRTSTATFAVAAIFFAITMILILLVVAMRY